MGHLEQGTWVTDKEISGHGGRYRRPPTRFHGVITADGSSGHPAELERYHLFVSRACPWAHRALITRRLKKIEHAITVSVSDPVMDDQGWRFDDYPFAEPVREARHLHEVYVRAEPEYTGRATVPVLWDRVAETIVNNESVELVRMFDAAFDAVSGDGATALFPGDQRDEIEAMIEANYRAVNNGVYRCGFAGSQEAYDEAVEALFARLDECERVLSRQRYLCGSRITAADVCLFPTLYRFDAVYNIHFRCSVRRVADYPNLWAYARDLYQTPGFGETCSMEHIRQHYYRCQESIHPRRTVAALPAHVDFEAPHDRARFDA